MQLRCIFKYMCGTFFACFFCCQRKIYKKLRRNAIKLQTHRFSFTSSIIGSSPRSSYYIYIDMQLVVIVLLAALAATSCLAAVPLDQPKRLVAARDSVVEPEEVLAEPLNPALVLAPPSGGLRVVRQAYDEVSVDVVNSECFLYISCSDTIL